MATGPQLPQSPLEALNNDNPHEDPWLKQFWGPGVGGLIGFVSVTFAQWATKRPLTSGVQRYVIWTGLGVALGKYLDDYRLSYFADRDAMFRHYVELHPDDFPPYKRQTFAEVFEPWVPIR